MYTSSQKTSCRTLICARQLDFWLLAVSSFDNFKMHGLQAWLLHSAFMLSVVKMLLKGEVGGHALNGHGNYIVDHGKSWKNHGIVFLNFCGNPVLNQMVYFIRMPVNIFLPLACITAFFAELQTPACLGQ